MATTLLWHRATDCPDAIMPNRRHPTDSGIDFFSAEEIEIYPGEVKTIRTGICVQPTLDLNDQWNSGYNVDWTLGAFVWDKSGIAASGLTVLGGVIDNGYTDEVKIVVSFVDVNAILLALISGAPHQHLQARRITKGMKLTQLVIQRVELPLLEECQDFEATARGGKGFGQSG
jgi:dUTP pyrophosphatase